MRILAFGIFALLTITTSVQAAVTGYETYPITSVPVKPLSSIEGTNLRKDYVKLCSTDGLCDAVLVAHIQDLQPLQGTPGFYHARYDLVVTNPNAASALAGIEVPTKVEVKRVSDSDFNYLMAKTTLTVDEANANRHPNPGDKLIDCVLDGAVCGVSALTGAMLTDWGWLFAIKECNSARKSCGEFKDAWDKEREYWKALEEENKKKGMGPDPNQPAPPATGSTGASGGAISPGVFGVGGTPVGTGSKKEPEWEIFDPESGTWTPI